MLVLKRGLMSDDKSLLLQLNIQYSGSASPEARPILRTDRPRIYRGKVPLTKFQILHARAFFGSLSSSNVARLLLSLFTLLVFMTELAPTASGH